MGKYYQVVLHTPCWHRELMAEGAQGAGGSSSPHICQICEIRLNPVTVTPKP